MRIGLEIHVRPRSKRKLFSRALNLNSTVKRPNSNVDPWDLGIPGAMPVLNREVVVQALKLAIALRSKVNERFYFDRKHYRYFDLPLGYQITQFHQPIAQNGYWEKRAGNRIRIKQLHMEIDAAKTVRDGENWEVDYNRSGVPLIEVVTEPDFESFAEVKSFLSFLQDTCRGYGISDCDLSKGDLRFDLNVSHIDMQRQEIKNLNSLQSAEKCIDFASQLREQKSYTWDWNEESRELTKSRAKETFNEYFYLREPDLPLYKVGSRLMSRIRYFTIMRSRSLESLKRALRDEHIYRKAINNPSLELVLRELLSETQLRNLGKGLAWSHGLTNRQINEIKTHSLPIKDRILKDFVTKDGALEQQSEGVIPTEEQWLILTKENKDLWDDGILKGNLKLVGPLIAVGKKLGYSVQWINQRIKSELDHKNG